MRLMQPNLNAGHCLYIDNYYTSPTLFNDLYELNTGTCGTARYRKGIPHAFQSIFPLVFTVHIEHLYLVQGENKVTGAAERFQKGACL